jgi:Fe-S oxidoreductase
MEADLVSALDGCLGCKACASACPVQVDVPTMRSAFLADYYCRHRRPLADRLVLVAERLSPLALRAAPLLAPVWPIAARLGEALTHTTALPRRLSGRPSRSLRWGRGSLPPNAVALVDDWFTALFDADLRRDAVAGFTALGYAPRILRLRPSGKAALNLGDMRGFGVMARALMRDLQAVADRGIPLVGLDPALVMVLRQDYPKQGLHPPRVLLPQEFLVEEIAKGRALPKACRTGAARLLSHCTETTGLPGAARMWSEVFAAIGLHLETPASGCCGMAGLFGHQKRHQEVSRKLFDLSWRDHVQCALPIAATGFSCRCQTERLGGKPARHPLAIIAEALRNG